MIKVAILKEFLGTDFELTLNKFLTKLQNSDDCKVIDIQFYGRGDITLAFITYDEPNIKPAYLRPDYQPDNVGRTMW